MMGGDITWDDLASFTGWPDVVVVLLAQELDTHHVARGFTAGCSGVVHLNGSAAWVRSVVEAAVRGEALLATEVVQELAVKVHTSPLNRGSLTPPEASLLNELANGATIAKLARQFGWSERTLGRRLHDLKSKLRVTTRAQAILRAAQMGAIE
ncbi:MAG: LuxR C-terminal-related transcriptional regulator [Acidimicrobiia bacterium]